VPPTSRPTLTVLVVSTQPSLEGAAARVRRLAISAATGSRGFEVIDAVDALDPDGARERKARAAEGLAAIRAAQRAYNELDTVKALAEANRALEVLSGAGAAARIEDVTDAWLLKIASLTANGNQKAAHAETDRLLTVNAAAQFSPDLFSPERIAYAEKARRKARAGTARLDIRTRPSGAEVYVDGTFRGISPITVERIASGEHVIVATVPGYATAQERSWPGAVDLELRETERGRLLRTANDGLLQATDVAGREAAARSYAKSIGASEVLLILLGTNAGMDEVQLTGVRLDSSNGRRNAQREETISRLELAERATPFIESLLTVDGLSSAAIAEVAAGSGAQTAWSGRRVAGWALLGAGAAVIIAGAVFGLQANRQSYVFHQLEQTNVSEARKVETRGRTFALIADLSFLLGGLAGGAGGYLSFTRDETTGIPAHAVADGGAR
jgi:hypothetical protein